MARTERYDYTQPGSGLGYTDYNKGLWAYNKYLSLNPGDPGYDHGQAASNWLTEKGFDAKNPTAKQAYSALDWRFRDVERGNQKENFGLDDLAGFVGPVVGLATGNPWLAAAAGGLSSGASSGWNPLSTALGAVGGYAAGSSNLFGPDGFLGSKPGSISNWLSNVGKGGAAQASEGAARNALANAVPGGSSGITTPYGAGGLTTAQGAGQAAVGGNLTLAGSGGASIGWNPAAVLGGAAAKSAGVASTAANLAKYANGKTPVPGTNQIYGPPPSQTPAPITGPSRPPVEGAGSPYGDWLAKAAGLIPGTTTAPQLAPDQALPGYGGSPAALPTINALAPGGTAALGGAALADALASGSGGGGNSPQGADIRSGAGAGRMAPQQGRVPGYQRRPFANYLMVA